MFAFLKPKRSWFQYSLRTLLLFTALCGVAARWVLVPVDEARRQHKAAQEIVERGGRCYWCRGKPLVPNWMGRALGLDHWISISHVKFPEGSGDGELALLDDLPDLLSLMQSGSRVTDAGLRHVAGLTELVRLNLSDTQVTNAGLRQLVRLKKLQHLDLTGAQVTADGVKGLQKDLPNCRIIVGHADRL